MPGVLRPLIGVRPTSVALQSASTSTGGIGGNNPPAGVLYMPPETQLVLPGVGTFTFAAGPGSEVLLNGVGTGLSSALLELGSNTLYAHVGNIWYQWFDHNGLFGNGWGPLTLFGDVDPAIYTGASVPAYQGPSNAADIWELELTSFAAVQAKASYTLNAAYPANQQYLTDPSGMKYMRFTSSPDPADWGKTYGQNGYAGAGNIILTWFLRLGKDGTSEATRTSTHIRYCMYWEDDVAPNVNTSGIKLPGIINQSFNPTADPDYPARRYMRMFMRFPQSNTFSASDHIESDEMFLPQYGGLPIISDFGVWYKTNRWYSIEQQATLNDIGVANGILRYWINGNMVYERTNVDIRNDPNTLFRSFHVDIYHGGLDTPKGIMTMRMAKLAVSTSYIGVPAELLTTTPAWRVPMTTVGQVYQIANTANMATTPSGPDSIPNALGGGVPINWGKNFEDVACYGGYANDDHSFWSVASGGHNGQWSNKVIRCDFDADQPLWKLDYAGTQESNYNSTTGTALIPSFSAADGPPALFYYYDSKPCARHPYYSHIYIGARNRVFMFYCGSSFGGASSRKDNVDAYNISSKTYDSAGTWPNSHIYDLSGNGVIGATCAKHPTTEDVYLKGYDQIKKWTQTSATWSDFVITGGSFTNSVWQSHGSLIDVSRNRWVSMCDPANIQYITLSGASSGPVSSIPIVLSGDGITYQTDASNTQSQGGVLLHDLDNDRYLHVFGFSNDGITNDYPGKIYSIHPTTGVVTKICDLTTAIYTGVFTRAAYFQKYGGVMFLPLYESNILFIPTRSVM